MSRLDRRSLLSLLGAGVLGRNVVDAHAATDTPTVYVGGDGTLYAVDAGTGQTHWEADWLSGHVWSSPTVVDGTVYVGSKDGSVYALSATTGEREWTFSEPSDQVNSSPTVVGNTLYVGSHDGTLYALDARTGAKRWRYDGPSEGTWSSPAVSNGTAYIGAEDNALHAVDTDSGEREWVFVEPDGPVRSSPVVTTVANDIGERTIYVGSHDGSLYAVDADSGEQVWRFEQPEDTVFGSPAVLDIGGDDGRPATGPVVYVGSSDTTLYAVDARSGERLWAFTDPSRRVPSSPTVYAADDGSAPILYVGTSELDFVDGEIADSSGALYAVDATTGEKRWQFAGMDGAVESSPTVVDRTVVVGSYDGTLYALDALTGEVAWTMTEPSARLHSSPAAVKARDGSASGSRARLRTLGHHDEYDPPPLPVTLDTPSGTGGLDPGLLYAAAGGGAAAFLGIYAAVRTRGSSERKGQSETDGATGKHGPPEQVPTTTRTSVPDDRATERERLAGRGGTNVYRVRTADGDDVALKEFDAASTRHTDTPDQFVDGFGTWAKLDAHNHVVSVVDYGPEPVPWIAMEYMDGGHLGDRAGEMSFDQALWTAVATTKAVRYAHRRGVTHHRIKPSNVLFRTVPDAWDAPKVSDWGQPHRTNSDGPARYRAPEQHADRGKVSDRTDIYRLGVVCYELFTGRYPFEADTPIDRSAPTPPSDVADVPQELDGVLATALATRPEDRYETVVHFRNALQELS